MRRLLGVRGLVLELFHSCPPGGLLLSVLCLSIRFPRRLGGEQGAYGGAAPLCEGLLVSCGCLAFRAWRACPGRYARGLGSVHAPVFRGSAIFAHCPIDVVQSMHYICCMADTTGP